MSWSGSPSGRNYGRDSSPVVEPTVGTHGILTRVSDLDVIREAARAFRVERDWERFQDPKSTLLALVGEVGELAELIQWLPADVAAARVRDEPLRTRMSEELSDVLIYLVGLADQCDVDLGQAALDKIRASAAKHPVNQVRGTAPDRSRSRD